MRSSAVTTEKSVATSPGDHIEVHAEEITGAERDKLYARHSSIMTQFAEYAQKTKRIIPVIALTPRNKKLISEH